ncbi:fatty-acid amide hydrolase 2 [Coccinella septempunctata]|uniref:fatty-acid amide hydrolase 2 n=1 Tax=Coccinella septempunctata TaxID=41139 RepID=UPI001D07A629|nr:fatty-acid amide hydrolase 2 [Coccinella septempunctata]
MNNAVPETVPQRRIPNEMKTFIDYLISFVTLLFTLYDYITHTLFYLMYTGCERWGLESLSQKVPPIADMLLLDSASQIAYKIRTRKLKCEHVMESFISRIEQINPVLNCVVAERFQQARAEAKKVDELLDSKAVPLDVLAKDKPFLGVPFTTKDGIALKGLIYSAGLVARKKTKAEEDAVTVRNLRNAGAIPIALTNISELCMWWESYNNVHGRTRNPYDTCRIVGGSSGGEGCVQAAAGSAFGLGSDIGGSIRMPALFNGVFGHKPSPSMVSIVGQFPSPTCEELQSFLGLGPMCRHAEDLAPLLKVLAGDKAAELRLDETVDVKDINIFYQEDDAGSLYVSPVNKEIRALFKKVSTYFEKAHKKSMKKLELKDFRRSTQIWLACMKTANGPSFQQQLANLEGDMNLPLELAKWCIRCSNHTFIALCTAITENSGVKYGGEEHTRLLQFRDHLKKELLDILGDNGVLIYPTHPTVAPYHNEPIMKPFNFSYTGIINVLGLPATHIPMGLNSEGLPMGLQVIAAPKNDRLCLAMAIEFEKAFGGWVPLEVE